MNDIAKTISQAKANYAAKMQNAGANWNNAKGRMKGNWAQGMSAFLGGPVSSQRAAAYSAGIDRAQYHGGDPDKWERNFRAAMTGG